MIKRKFEKTKQKLTEITKSWGKGKVYLVGGCVRDQLLGISPKDIDICIDYPDGTTDFCNYLKENGLGKDFAVYPRFGTAKFTLIETNVQIECVIPRTETYNSGPRKPDSVKYSTIEEDAKRRDFCCNALYLDLLTDKMLDPTGYGIQDIKNKILRTPLPARETFIDDPLRMLRAFRFSATLRFTILPEVYSEIKPYPEYSKLSMERVKDEFEKIMRTSEASNTIRKLHETGLLGYIIPEFEESWGFNQNSKYHSMNLTDHSLAVLDYVMVETFNIDIRIAALLHDIAKYKCWKLNSRGEFSYHGHEELSAELAAKILERLKFPKDRIQKIFKIIKYHMIIKHLYNPTTDSYTGSDAQTRKIIRILGEDLSSVMTLINADNKAHSPKYNMPGQVKSFIEKLVNIKTAKVIRTCPVSGDEIMKELSLKPGPVIREIKEIFLNWLDEKPELKNEELLERYRVTYPDDKYFWIWKNDNESIITFGEPIKYNRSYSSPDNEIPYRLDYSIGVTDKPQYWKASEHPDLYRRLLRFKKSWEIFDKSSKEIREFLGVEGFKSIFLTMDSDYDFSVEIKWEDEKPTYIV